ncbi:MAG: hypothetical protein PHF11_00540 [Candidatus Omnitrophica bacterium]|nr:hypothetical protein [Candidatus Omnitrophota bacterium]
MANAAKIEKLERALDAEQATAVCCGRLAALIKNARIRKNFLCLSEAAKNNQRLLYDRLKALEAKGVVPQDKCEYCRINPESFSLDGAINLGLEVTSAAIKIYKGLLACSQGEDDKKLFEGLIKEKKGQFNSFKKEKKFMRTQEDKFNMIDSYCVSKIISQLLK